jgi:hypothetical protein
MLALHRWNHSIGIRWRHAQEEAGNPQPTLSLNSGNTFRETSAIMSHYMTYKLIDRPQRLQFLARHNYDKNTQAEVFIACFSTVSEQHATVFV